MKTISQSHAEEFYIAVNKYVRVPADNEFLLADLQVPYNSTSLVILAFDFGGSRNHPRARHIARVIRSYGLATLLCDLVTEDEEVEDEVTKRYSNNVSHLSKRLIAVTKWAMTHPDTKRLRMSYFGASTGGGAALIAAAKLGNRISAVVSRGGRLDLAASSLSHVACPALLIAGENDISGVKFAREAMERLRCEKELQIVPGASHLFGEPGKLESMAQLSATWLRRHLDGGREIGIPSYSLDC